MSARGFATLALLAIVLGVGTATAAPPAPPRARSATGRHTAAATNYYRQPTPAAEDLPPPEATSDAGDEETIGLEEWQASQAAGDPYEEFGMSPGGFGDECCGAGGGCDGCDVCLADECGPVWFAGAEVLALHRSTAHDQVITQTPQIFTIAGQSIVVQRQLQSTRSFDFSFEPGLRTRFGRFLGTDLLNREHTLEFDYFGLLQWDANHEIIGDRVDSFLVDNSGQVFPAIVGRLNTPFPLAVGGFNRADVHHIQNWSNLNNFEVNYRIRKRQRGGRMVGWPDGSWSREPTPGRTPSMLIGLRYISLDDNFQWLSRGSTDNLLTGINTPFSGDYSTKTSNDLLGLQIGGDFVYRWTRASIGFRGKAGMYCNVAQASTHLETKDSSGLFLLPQRDYSLRGERLGFVGEFGVIGTWDLTRNTSLRAGWDLLWIQGIALAPEQLAFDLAAPPTLIDSGSLFFQGASLGFEMRW